MFNRVNIVNVCLGLQSGNLGCLIVYVEINRFVIGEVDVKKVVITGATGTVGRALIKVCSEAGYEVLAVVHRTSERAAELKTIDNCCVLYLDLSEYDNAMDEMEKQGIDLNGYELFFHLAWSASFGKGRNNLELQLENVKASLAAVRFAKSLGCTTFIGAGSQAEYGRVTEKLSPDTPAFPETGYGVAKLCAGQMTRLTCEQMDMKHIWTRILSVYGPHDGVHSLISVAIDDMMHNRETSFTPCDQIWDYIYSDDAARAMLLATQKGNHGSVYVIGSGEARPLKQYIQKIAAITNYRKEIGFSKRPYNDKQVMFLQADLSVLKEWGFVPKVSFEKGIQFLVSLHN